MVLVSYSGREINAKLVYYGPGLSGKTTNLEFIYGSIPQGQRGKMVSMKTKTERTLFFDFLPVHLGELSGFKTRFLLYTVPGQVYYNATRKLVLKGVDAVVFVADSKRGKMDENVESLENLRENLKELSLTLDKLPWVIQYNKRDLPDIYTLDELEAVLNPGRAPAYEGVASTGAGVVETFKGVSRLLLRKLAKDVGVPVVGSPAQGATPAALPPPPAPAAAIEVASRRFQTAPAHEAAAATPVIESFAPAPPPRLAPEEPAWELPPVAEPVRMSATGGTGFTEPARPGDDLDSSEPRVSVGERLRRWLSRSSEPEPNEFQSGATPGSPDHIVIQSDDSREMPAAASPGIGTASIQPPQIPEGIFATHAENPPLPVEVPVARIEVPPAPAAAPVPHVEPTPQSFEVPVACLEVAPATAAAPVSRVDAAPPPVVPPIQHMEPAPAPFEMPAAGSEMTPAHTETPPDAAAQPRPSRLPAARRRPREILVPLEISARDLAEGVVLKVVIRPQEAADTGDDEVEQFAA